MGKLWSYLIFLGCISYLMIGGLLMFINGFFLTKISRLERNNCISCNVYGNCNIKELIKLSVDNDNNNKSFNICLETETRVVLLIVDALKYEFLKWDNNISQASYHRNKLPIVNELLNKYPDNTRLYKALADPPTTTMQRIKALTTGTLPTFIDISYNFASGKIQEDNIIDQINNKSVFMGDNTWTQLYPNKFIRQFPSSSSSFNIWDLDTVDKEVRYRLFFELKKTDWSLLIAHTLGVDHCGHKHGQNHPEMTRKLFETNELIKEIIDLIDNDTMLFVIGDHGMTESGDHGGDSKKEIEAGLFIYSNIKLQHTKKSSSMVVNQIDIVPTLSIILGIPIPFSNLGSVIFDVLPFNSDFLNPVYYIWNNILQTKKYINIYSSESFLFSKDKTNEINHLFDLLKNEIINVNNDTTADNFIKHSQEYLKLLRDSCAEIWIQFDSNLMSKGLLLIFGVLFFMYLFINQLTELRIISIFESSFLKVFLISNLITILITYILYIINITDEFINNNFFTTGLVSLFLFFILIVQNWDNISITWYNNTKNKKIKYLTRIIVILIFLSVFSNSYIVEEDKILSFLLTTLICLTIYYNRIRDDNEIEFSNDNKKTLTTIATAAIHKPTSFNNHNKSSNIYKYKTLLTMSGFIVCLSIRMTSYFWRCREEQTSEMCLPSFIGKVGSIKSNNIERIFLTISLIGLALYVTIIRIWLRNCGNLSGFSPSVIISRYCPPLIVVCTGSYWVLQRLPKDAKVKLILSHQLNALPIVVYFFVTIAIFILLIKPLTIFLLPKERQTVCIYNGENIIPKLFYNIKELFYKKKNNSDNNYNNDNDIPLIYGLGTVYSASFISLSVFITLLYALLLGNILASSVFLMIIICSAVLIITTIERYRNSNDFRELLQIPTSTIFSWFLIAEYFFYATGHQSTFSTIHWDAAFIGTSGHFYSNIIPAIMIGINTFGSHIILGITLPLLVIAPITLLVMFPKLAKPKLQNEIIRGELIFSNKESTFHYSILSVSGKYILIHAFRTFGCMLAATIHCRHLMVWKIFAPKLIFESFSFLISIASVLLSIFMVLRIDNQILKLIEHIEKLR